MLPLNNDHLSAMATILGSQGWSLCTVLTVSALQRKTKYLNLELEKDFSKRVLAIKKADKGKIQKPQKKKNYERDTNADMGQWKALGHKIKVELSNKNGRF